MNSVDCNFVRGFYEEFCVRGCQYLDCAKIESGSTCLDILEDVKPINVKGIDKLFQRFDSFSRSIPDCSFELNRSHINREINQPGSRVVMWMTTRATVVKHSVVAVQSKNRRRYLVPSFLVSELTLAGKIDASTMNLEKHPPDAQHISLCVSGETVLWLDNNHRIYRITAMGDLQVRYHD
eukprot:gene11521-12895_t